MKRPFSLNSIFRSFGPQNLLILGSKDTNYGFVMAKTKKHRKHKLSQKESNVNVIHALLVMRTNSYLCISYCHYLSEKQNMGYFYTG